jgi:hypothetical protein
VFKVKIVLSTPNLLETPPHRQAAKRYVQEPENPTSCLGEIGKVLISHFDLNSPKTTNTTEINNLNQNKTK